LKDSALGKDVPPPEELRKRTFRKRSGGSPAKRGKDPKLVLMEEFIGAVKDGDAESALDIWRTLSDADSDDSDKDE